MLITIFSDLMSGNMESLRIDLAIFLLSLPIIILALSVHEVAHGYVAYKLGDPTAKSLGRLTLNPIKHLDPIGLIFMMVFGFGYTKPVPVNSRYFKKPKRDMVFTSLAGPASNIILAIIFAALFIGASLIPISVMPNEIAFNALYFTKLTLEMGIQLNLMLAFFNLIPCPPLDGSSLLYAFLPPKATMFMIKYERFFYYGLLILVLLRVIPYAISFMTNLATFPVYYLIAILQALIY